MDLSIIIVNYNVEHFLSQCLTSVRKAAGVLTNAGFAAEVWVVDNRSVDGSCEMIRSQFPEVRLIALETNVGFSKGNNEAIRQSNGRWVLLLNPDTVLPEDALLKTMRYAESNDKLGGLGVPMVDGQGRFLPESKRGLPTPWVSLCKITGIYRLAPKSKRFNRYYQGHLGDNENSEIEILSGAFMWMRRAALDEVGLLDETYFMYGEDIDLSWRIIKGGWENHYFAETSIIHYKGESTKKGSLNYVLVFYRAMLIFAKTHFKGSQGHLLMGFIRLAIYFRAGLAIASRITRKWLLPAVEWLLLWGGLLLLLKWYSTQTGILYDWSIARIALATYALVWLVAVAVNGGYDRPWKSFAIVKGVALGSLVLMAFYGLLPEALRFSRAVLVLGSVFSAVVFFVVRTLVGGRHWQNQQTPIRLYVGGDEELEKMIELVSSMDVNPQFDRTIWALNPLQESPAAASLNGNAAVRWIGGPDDLSEAVRVHNINEVVLSGRDLSAYQIIDLMSRVADDRVDFRIAWSEGGHVMGSGGPELGPITEWSRAIQRPASRRSKRILDIAFSMWVLVLFPLFIAMRRWIWVSGAMKVILGKATWVGFSKDLKGFPGLRPCLLSRSYSKDDRVKQRINLTYARDYRWATDLGVIREALISRRAIHRHGNN